MIYDGICALVDGACSKDDAAWCRDDVFLRVYLFWGRMCGINDCLEFRVYCEPTHVTRQTATNIALQATPGEQRKKGTTFRLYLVCACTCRGGVRGVYRLR